ncbi:MAG: acetyltransferase [Leptospiraceae bacterium]|nr:acetyltransferase [Leptospiraceae bacterium]
MLVLYCRYGFYGFIRLIRDYLLTFIFYNNSRILRYPNYIRGKKYIDFGKSLTTGVGLRIDAMPINKSKIVLKFGCDIELNDYVHIGAIDSITIGNNVLIASKVFITDHNHGNYSGDEPHNNPNIPPRNNSLHSSPVEIQDNVWIGENVSILPGVTVGKGSIIGAMSLVNKNIPPYSLAVGIPAKVVKTFNFESKKWEKIQNQ